MWYARELQAQGRIRHIGMSSHNPVAAQAAVESGLINVLMFSVNPCYDLQPPSEDCEDLWRGESYAKDFVNMDPDREKLYETCQRLGVAITVMKAFGGGDLLQAKLSPAGKAFRRSRQTVQHLCVWKMSVGPWMRKSIRPHLLRFWKKGNCAISV